MNNLQDYSPDIAHDVTGSSRLPTLSAATAARSGLSEGVIRLAIHSGELPVLEVRSDQGREYHISPRDLDQFMHGYRVGAATLSVADAVVYSGLPVRTIHRTIQCGDLPVEQVAGRTGWEYRIALADLDAFMKVHVPGGQTLQAPSPSPSTGDGEHRGSFLPPQGERLEVQAVSPRPPAGRVDSHVVGGRHTPTRGAGAPPPFGTRGGSRSLRESRYDWLWTILIVLAVVALAINAFALAMRLIADYWTL
jgi:hypothetical protein